MVKCPWGCGWEGTPEEYSKHLETCTKYLYKDQIGKGPEQTPRLLIKMEVGLVKDDHLLQEVFNELNKMLEGPPLVLEIHRKRRYRFVLDAYAGVEGKVILTINQSKLNEISYDEVAATLIHEILHHKFPEDLELEIERKTEQAWKTLFATLSYPREFFETWRGIRKWEARVGRPI